MVVFFPYFSIFLWYLVAYPNTYNFCFSLYLAPILFLVQNLLIWCKFVSKILIIIFFGAACIYRYFYVPVQFATFLSGCILVTFWFLVPLFAIIIWFWLPFQYTIITGLFDNLHPFGNRCNFKKRGAFTANFCKYFHFRLWSPAFIFTSFYDILQPWKMVAFSGCIWLFFPRFSTNFQFRLLPLTLIIAVFFSILQPLKLVVFLVTFGCIPNSNWLHY